MTKHQLLPTRKTISYQIATIQKYGQICQHFVEPVYGRDLFPGQYYDQAWDFYDGYALVVARGRFFHIDQRGKIAYRWRFTDASIAPLDNKIAKVQHPRALGWSLFHIPTGIFITNPPQYRR
ncbi:MAG: hypothetical protein ACK42D_00635 [Candidatus Paceibacteria bacterium]